MNDKLRQYDYKANSNLVLPTDTGLIDKRPSNEATGEVQTLAGRISGKMGDRVSSKSSDKPSKLEEDGKKRESKDSKRRRKDESLVLMDDLTASKGFSIADIEIKDLLYQPKSELTAAAYGLVIKFVRKFLGFQHNSIINGAADEVIASMKDPKLDEQSRRVEIESLLAPDSGLDDEDYNELCNLCKKINDWGVGKTKMKEDTAEEVDGDVGVILPDDDSMSDEYLGEVEDSGDDFDLDDMFEKAAEVSEALNIEELAKRHNNIVPRLEIGEPIRKEGYHEYRIEPKKRSSQKRDNLIKIEDLSENEREAFRGFKSLNLIQSIIYKKAMTSDKSLLICAPTGAGKTNIALLTMLREILKYPNRDGPGFDTEKFKIIYVAPIKALVQEIVDNFTKKLGGPPFNLIVDELTGDHQLDQRQISRAQIIVCTPEKWDIVTRKSLDRLYTKIVRLVIFDEIHLLHNERGATLEALVARIKRHKHIEGEPIRIIGLSATLPNYRDVSRFIAPEESEENSTFYFDASYRPIPLRQQYIAMTESKKALKMINDIVYEKVIERLPENAQVLIFVHSRPDTAKTAEYIKIKALEDNKVGLFLSSESAVDTINEQGKNMNPKLKELLQFGIGIHHAGMSKHERSCVEELFRGRFVKVLVSTATLAWGVNLPARTVIIKGTQVYRDGRWTDLDSLDVTQMLGRAGRPGYDREGEGIVITQQSQVAFYISLMTEQLPVESRLIGRLAEFINAECVIGNIESLDGAVNWLSETYLSSRMMTVMMQDNRQYKSIYGISDDARNRDPQLASHKHNLAYNACCILDDRGLIIFDRSSGAIKSTELGRIASDFNCSSRTIKLFHDSIHEHTSDIELFRTFSMADEFKDIFVRRGEEADLMTLLNQVPFPIDDKRATPGANKVNALLQVYIFRMNIEGSDLICDMHFIRDSAARLARAIHEIVLMKGYANVAELSFDLCRKIDKRMTSCHSALRQFSDDLDADIVNRLEKKNYHVEELRILKADKITELLRCDRYHGEKIYKLLKCLPRLKIEASIKPISKNSLKIELTVRPDFSWNEKYHGFSERFWLMVEDVNQEIILHYEMLYLRKHSDRIKATFFVPYLMPAHPFYFIRILPDNWFGCDHHLPVYIEKLTLPEESSITTQLEDLESQMIRSLENPLFERYYDDKFKGAGFNQIQTQAFRHIYRSNDDIILLASAGSGKTTCAELAVIRNINLYGTGSKCGYIGANREVTRVIYDLWKKIFGKHYGIVLLTGKRREDLAKVEDSSTNIVIGDPESWHSMTLTKAKRYRKFISKFQVFIIDDIHLLHCDHDSTLEWLCAKLRIITKLEENNPARFVALGSPITGAESIKNWLAYERGSKEPKVLNYPPSIRPVKLELIVQKYHHYDYKMRLMTMQRPIYRLITQTAKERPVLIFVSDYRKALDLSDTLINYCKGEKKRLTCPQIDLNKIHESNMRRSISYGIGYLYRGMNQVDRYLIEDLYSREQIQVLIVTAGMCWSINLRSYLVIIADTQHHNGLEASDYELTDIMQMVGLAGKQLAHHECKCVIMCQSSKANYYERFLRDPLPIESNLPANVINYINYEVVLGTVAELNNIYKPYLAHTYFYKRITINPNYYGVIVPRDSEGKTAAYGSFFNDLVSKVALELEKNDFLVMEGTHENPTFTGALLGRISLEYYISYETLLNYTKWLASDSKSIQLKTLELIELISTNTYEFRHIQVKHGELDDLKYLKRRYRLRDGEIHSNTFKVKLIILSQYQKTDGKEDPLEGELIEDRYFVLSLTHRLLMAIVDIACIKDSFGLAKGAIQLAKKMSPFNRKSRPNLDMEVNLTKEVITDEEGKDLTKVVIDITIEREDDPFTVEEFERDYRLPESMFRNEGWSFLVYGQLKSKDDSNSKYLEKEKFQHFKRIKTPAAGKNEYKLEFSLSDNSATYTYDLYLMSDFYSSSEDRKVPLEII